jgi:hypothetical protein
MWLAGRCLLRLLRSVNLNDGIDPWTSFQPYHVPCKFQYLSDPPFATHIHTMQSSCCN